MSRGCEQLLRIFHLYVISVRFHTWSRPVTPVSLSPGQTPKMVPTVKFVSTIEEPSRGSKATENPDPWRSTGSGTSSLQANFTFPWMTRTACQHDADQSTHAMDKSHRQWMAVGDSNSCKFTGLEVSLLRRTSPWTIQVIRRGDQSQLRLLSAHSGCCIFCRLEHCLLL